LCISAVYVVKQEQTVIVNKNTTVCEIDRMKERKEEEEKKKRSSVLQLKFTVFYLKLKIMCYFLRNGLFCRKYAHGMKS